MKLDHLRRPLAHAIIRNRPAVLDHVPFAVVGQALHAEHGHRVQAGNDQQAGCPFEMAVANVIEGVSRGVGKEGLLLIHEPPVSVVTDEPVLSRTGVRRPIGGRFAIKVVAKNRRVLSLASPQPEIAELG